MIVVRIDPKAVGLMKVQKVNGFRRHLTLSVGILAAAMLLSTATAEAQYLDPGSGSYLLQFVIAALLAGVIFLKSIVVHGKPVLTRILRKVFGNGRRDSA